MTGKTPLPHHHVIPALNRAAALARHLEDLALTGSVDTLSPDLIEALAVAVGRELEAPLKILGEQQARGFHPRRI